VDGIFDTVSEQLTAIIKIVKPPNSDSLYMNDDNTSGVVLLAAVNGNHQLVMADEGTIGKVFESLKQTSLLSK
jgi:hypothetical protein